MTFEARARAVLRSSLFKELTLMRDMRMGVAGGGGSASCVRVVEKRRRRDMVGRGVGVVGGLVVGA